MTDKIIIENNYRKQSLFPKYNPDTGSGSPLERFKLYLSEREYIYLPKSMMDFSHIKDIIRSGSLDKYFPNTKSKEKITQTTQPVKTNKTSNTSTKKDFQKQLKISIYRERFRQDFEYWAYKAVKIRDKQSGIYVPFVLRPPQRKLLSVIENLRQNNQPIRIILLKARQWGGSTLVQIYMMWLQTYHKRNWNSVIGTDVIAQGENIKSMYETACSLYPKVLGKLTLKPFGRSGNVRRVVQTNAKIYLGSMQKPDTLRSGDYSMAHLSEVGLWKETNGKKPEDVISSICSSILLQPYTMIIEESTAKGEGNYFHKKWLSAQRSDNGFIPVFVAWWEIELYQIPFCSTKEQKEFYNNLNSKGKFLWELGATLEGIHWYQNYQKTSGYTDWQMCEEFPSTAEEAFVSSGQRVIPLEYMQEAKKTIRQPIFTGEILADGQKYKEALQNIHFEPNDKYGRLKIWSFPEKDNKYSNRYIVSMDIGGRSQKADKSVIRVIDRYWRAEGGVDEFVATWRGNIDVDLAVWKAVQLAKIYDNALLVVESNTIDTKYQHTEGDHTYTIFDEIADYYDNLYYRDNPQRIKENLPVKYGFHTNTETKQAIINNLIASYRDNLFIEHDQEMITESNQFEIKADRKMGAKEGCNDDVFMASAMGLYVSNKIDRPFLKHSQKITAAVIRPLP